MAQAAVTQRDLVVGEHERTAVIRPAMGERFCHRVDERLISPADYSGNAAHGLMGEFVLRG